MSRVRKPRKSRTEDTDELYTEGCNDLAQIPAQYLRDELIRMKYHPDVVKIMPEWQLITTLREAHKRMRQSGQTPVPNFGSAVKPNLRMPGHYLHHMTSDNVEEDRHLILVYPEERYGVAHQVLQPTAPSLTDSAAPEPAASPELSVDANTALLDYGVLQSTIDDMTEDQIAKVMRGFEENLTIEEIVKQVGLKKGSTMLLDDYSQPSEECEPTQESEGPEMDEW